jgi:large subunit ribosomal protein L21
VELKDVLLLGGAGDVRIGTPIVDGARVLAEVIEHGRDKKILVFKYKNKTRYRRRHGHRQDFTRLAIRQILTEGQEAAAVAEKPKRPARKKAVVQAEDAAAEAPATAVAEKPKRPARKKAVVRAEEVAAEAPAAEAVIAEAQATAPPKPRRARAAKPKAEAAPEPAPEEAPVPDAAPEETPEGD